MVYLLRCTASHIIYQIAEVVLFLQFNFSVYVCHSEGEGLVPLHNLIVGPRSELDLYDNCAQQRFVYMRILDAAEQGWGSGWERRTLNSN